MTFWHGMFDEENSEENGKFCGELKCSNSTINSVARKSGILTGLWY